LGNERNSPWRGKKKKRNKRVTGARRAKKNPTVNQKKKTFTAQRKKDRRESPSQVRPPKERKNWDGGEWPCTCSTTRSSHGLVQKGNQDNGILSSNSVNGDCEGVGECYRGVPNENNVCRGRNLKGAKRSPVDMKKGTLKAGIGWSLKGGIGGESIQVKKF